METAQQWRSDWEKLFAKCTTDEDYRRQLNAAIAKNDRRAVLTLLDNIDAGGTGDDVRNARVEALRESYKPMIDLGRTFSGPEDRMMVAP